MTHRARKTGTRGIAISGAPRLGVYIKDESGRDTIITYAELIAVLGVGAGTVTGPGTSTPHAIVRFTDSSGSAIEEGGGPAVLEDDGRISGLADPTLAQDAATKAYVDAVAAGIGGGSGIAWVPLSLGVEPLTFLSDGLGQPILGPYTP